MLIDFFNAFSTGNQETIVWALITLLLSIPVVLFSLSIHEASHGYAAYRLGDPTAKNFGRLTINPIRHIDPIGTVAMIFLGIGWAKPVPINSRYFKKPKRDLAISSAAGPLSNLGQALIASLILFVGIRLAAPLSDFNALASLGKLYDFSMKDIVYTYIHSMIMSGGNAERIVGLILYLFYICAFLNVVLAIFNLIPIPPFDGSRIAYVFLPDKYYFGIMKYERVIMMALLVIFWFSGPLFSSFFYKILNLLFKCFSFIV